MVNQIKEEKKKENGAVNQHQNDVSGSLISHRNGFWPGSEKVLKSEILCYILKSQLLGRRLAIAQRKKNPHYLRASSCISRVTDTFLDLYLLCNKRIWVIGK